MALIPNKDISLAEAVASFNPNTNGIAADGIFGLPFSKEQANILILGVPFELTVSYGRGTAAAPAAILAASRQIDLYDTLAPNGWKAGIAYHTTDQLIELGREAENVREKEMEADKLVSGELTGFKENSAVNSFTHKMVATVKEEVSHWLRAGKIVGLLGGDHSTPLGYWQALEEMGHSFGILQIDAHADLRNSYEGYTHSHASIMYNALGMSCVQKLVQVGIRDMAHEEKAVMDRSPEKVVTYMDQQLKERQLDGEAWSIICKEIVSHLPDKVYISFDIDGLQPWLCPGTGTPVPDGLLLSECQVLLRALVESGKEIIGFDLVEVAPQTGDAEWNANVGARVLYKLCMATALSKGLTSE